ncbi:hypothetical protein [Streptococcus suis]
MTNEKLGVLLIDLPEPRYYKYEYIINLGIHKRELSIGFTDYIEELLDDAYMFTEEEAKKYPQFRWVALEELHDQ